MSKVAGLAKALGIALAAFIICMIIYSLLFVASLFMGIKDDSNLQEKKITNMNIAALDLDLGFVNLNMEAGSEFKVETNIKNIEIKEYEHKLKISTENSVGIMNRNRTINITIPEHLDLETIDLDIGGGNITVKNIVAKSYNVSLGMSKANFDNITATEKIKFDNGMGSIKVTNSTFSNLDFSNGIGSAKLEAFLGGKTILENGVGSLEAIILNQKKNYTIDISNGLGSVRIDGEDISQKKVGTGEKELNLDNGVGSVDIKFKN